MITTTTSIISELTACIFLLSISFSFLYGVLNPEKVKPVSLSDEIEIGTIKSKDPESFKQKSDQKNSLNTVDSNLKNECVLALVSLGSTRKESISTVNNFFENKDVKSVEEFLFEVFKKQ